MELYFYLNILIFPSGILLNLVQIYIFSMQALNTKTRIGYMHALLGCFNMSQLLYALIVQNILPLYFNVNLNELTDASCRVVNFIQELTLVIPSFQHVLITFQFYLSIKYPKNYFAYQKSKSKFILTSLIMIALVVALNIEFLFYELKPIGNDSAINASNWTVIYECNADFYLLLVSESMSVLLRYFLPFIINIFLNGLIILQVYRNQVKLNRSVKSYKDFFLSIVIINFIIFVFYLPWSIALILNMASITPTFLRPIIAATNMASSIASFYKIGTSVSFIVCILPFFVYVYFNRLFRREFFTIFQLSKLPLSVHGRQSAQTSSSKNPS